MAYVAWSVVFGETPSASKWNILGTNDAGFNDGTAIASGAITAAKISGFDYSLATTMSLPYKFLVKRVAAYNTVNSAFTKMPWDTKDFDTNTNFDVTTNFQYTAPVAGFYFFTGRFSTASASNLRWIPSIYKNGVEIQRGTDVTSVTTGGIVTGFMQLAANDLIDFRYYVTGAVGLEVGSGEQNFGGFLVSRT